MELHDFIIPVVSAVFAFAGAIIGNRTDIAWIKKELTRHDGEIKTLHGRVSRIHRK